MENKKPLGPMTLFLVMFIPPLLFVIVLCGIALTGEKKIKKATATAIE